MQICSLPNLFDYSRRENNKDCTKSENHRSKINRSHDLVVQSFQAREAEAVEIQSVAKMAGRIMRERTEDGKVRIPSLTDACREKYECQEEAVIHQSGCKNYGNFKFHLSIRFEIL